MLKKDVNSFKPASPFAGFAVFNSGDIGASESGLLCLICNQASKFSLTMVMMAPSTILSPVSRVVYISFHDTHKHHNCSHSFVAPANPHCNLHSSPRSLPIHQIYCLVTFVVVPVTGPTQS